MSQAGFTPIQLYFSTTAAATPSAGNLANGELAVNITDGKLFYKDNGGVVKVLATAGSLAGPGSSTDNALVRFDGTTGALVQSSVGVLSDAGVLTGLTGLTSSGPVTLSSLTSGRIPYATTSGLLTDSPNLTFSGTTLSTANAAIFANVTVGKGGGSVIGNTAIGQSALQLNTTGSNNTANGFFTLFANTTGINNTAVGQAALSANTTGINNTAVGNAALPANTTGTNNTAVGANALQLNTTGGNNTAIGWLTLFSNTTGANNTAIGRYALQTNTTGSGNTAINPNSSTGSYAPVFDPTTENNRFCAGSTAVTNAYVQVAWTVVSDARDKTDFAPVPHGLDFVNKLKPTAYRYKASREEAEAHGPVRYGFKAQDVLALEGETPVIVDAEDLEKLRFNDQALIAVLVNAVQELSAKVKILENK
jgi:hypothetical protein